MAFQIKDFASITASMINHARSVTKKITDWIPGSASRTLIEAPAVEIEELYLQFFTGLREAIPVATFKSFNFSKLPAKFARGFVYIEADVPQTENLVILIGSEFRTTDGRLYLSTAEVTFLAGEISCIIPVQASAVGASYNVSAGAISESPIFGAGYSVSNSAIDNGANIETDNEQESRFSEYIAALSRGTNSACLYGAKQAVVLDEVGNIIEYVTKTGLVENPGYVRIYLYSSNGLPSEKLIANAQILLDGKRDQLTQEIVPGYRSGGIRVDALPMTERLIPLTAQIKMLNGYVLDGAITQQITVIFATTLSNVNPGTVLYLGSLETDISSVIGVDTVVLNITGNIVCAELEVLKPGTILLSEI